MRPVGKCSLLPSRPGLGGHPIERGAHGNRSPSAVHRIVPVPGDLRAPAGARGLGASASRRSAGARVPARPKRAPRRPGQAVRRRGPAARSPEPSGRRRAGRSVCSGGRGPGPGRAGLGSADRPRQKARPTERAQTGFGLGRRRRARQFERMTVHGRRQGRDGLASKVRGPPSFALEQRLAGFVHRTPLGRAGAETDRVRSARVLPS